MLYLLVFSFDALEQMDPLWCHTSGIMKEQNKLQDSSHSSVSKKSLNNLNDLSSYQKAE